MDTERFFLLEEEVVHFSRRKTNLKSEGSNAVKFQFEARAEFPLGFGYLKTEKFIFLIFCIFSDCLKFFLIF